MLAQIDEILHPYRQTLGDAYLPYLNHASRVFSIAEKLDKESVLDTRMLAIACAFHDLGIWTENTWDYLNPSERLCSEYLRTHILEKESEEILSMIRNHHKLLPYKGKHSKTVELFRKADLIDFSGGLIRFGIPKKEYQELLTAFPSRGFHRVLFNQFRKHLLVKPWNPFPMMKL